MIALKLGNGNCFYSRHVPWNSVRLRRRRPACHSEDMNSAGAQPPAAPPPLATLFADPLGRVVGLPAGPGIRFSGA